MSFIYPFLLWVLLPLFFLLWTSRKDIINGVHSFILILILLSLARPITTQTLQDTQINSKEVIIALDVSYSMKAQDLKPNRYDFATETILAYLALNPRDNIMLLAFTTNPLLLSPPTTDHPLITTALKSLNPEFILTKGTSLKRLFSKISSMNTNHKSLILLSDGGEENYSQNLIQSIEKSQVSLHILALGTKQGTSIETSKDTLLKDTKGNLVISRINPLLQTLADLGYAKYFEASSSPQATASVLNQAVDNSHKRKQRIHKMQNKYQEHYIFPLLLALLLFLLLHTKGIKYLIIFFTLFGIQAQASFLDTYHLIHAYHSYAQKDFNSSTQHTLKIHEKSLESTLLLAHNYYQKTQYKKALALYASISSSNIKIKQYLYYHIGNCHAMLKAYDKAKSFYVKALHLGKDRDAEYNIGLIALLGDHKDASLGIAHPKSQSDASSVNNNTSSKEDNNDEDKPSSNSSGQGEGQSSQKNKDKEPSKLMSKDTEEEQPHPLGSKVYELINKGYIREKRPW